MSKHNLSTSHSKLKDETSVDLFHIPRLGMFNESEFTLPSLTSPKSSKAGRSHVLLTNLRKKSKPLIGRTVAQIKKIETVPNLESSLPPLDLPSPKATPSFRPHDHKPKPQRDILFSNLSIQASKHSNQVKTMEEHDEEYENGNLELIFNAQLNYRKDCLLNAEEIPPTSKRTASLKTKENSLIPKTQRMLFIKPKEGSQSQRVLSRKSTKMIGSY